MISAVRTMVQIPDTYEQLTWKLIGTFPKGFQRLDRYEAVSIKSGEAIRWNECKGDYRFYISLK